MSLFDQIFLNFPLQNSRGNEKFFNFNFATSIIYKFMKYLNFELYYSKTQH